MLQSKTLVLTSAHEGLGLVRLEALASGCCVVTTNTGGTSLFNSVRENGFFVAAADPENLADAMFSSQDSYWFTQENIAARKEIISQFNPSNFARELINLSFTK